jgi:hypothetical protein
VCGYGKNIFSPRRHGEHGGETRITEKTKTKKEKHELTP